MSDKIKGEDLTEIDLLLLGSTGVGKSKTGNSILGRPIFHFGSSVESITTDVQFDYAEVYGHKLKVVDVRGVHDTKDSLPQFCALFIEEMEKAILMSPSGYHAFLIFFRFGNRFTAQEQRTIEILKAIFGQDFIAKYCILIVTFGDQFKTDDDCNGLSLKDWCNKQSGAFKNFVSEFKNRILLFDNKSKDENVKAEQVQDLLNMVKTLQHGRYTDENFKQAEVTQKKLFLECDKPSIDESTIKEIGLLLQQLETYKNSIEDEVGRLENILIKTEALENYLSDRDRGTGLLHGLLLQVRELKTKIDVEIKANIELRKKRTAIEKSITALEQQQNELEKIFTSEIERMTISQRLRHMFDKELAIIYDTFEAKKRELKEAYICELQECRNRIASNLTELKQSYKKIKENHFSAFVNTILGKVSFTFQLLIEKLFRSLKLKN